MKRFFSFLVLIPACLFVLSACESLPRGAALQSEILKEPESGQAEFAVYQVDKSLLPKVAHWPRTGVSHSNGWVRRQQGPLSSVIAPGDRLSLSIWDSDDNSLLTTPEQKNVTMEQVVVSPDGTIFVPYLDRIYVSGLSADKARETIQEKLGVIAGSAQVQLTLLSGRSNSVDLVGGVGKAGNYPLPDRNFTVLNLVSAGGGITESLRNPQVRLIRGGKIYRTSVSRLYANPKYDTTLRGGDKVIIEQDDRYFLSLGAAGSESLMYFEKDAVTALDAMSMIGGISDSRGDPQGILILRQYSSKAVRDSDKGPSHSRTVFTVDLTTADGLFSAGRFAVYPGDVVLVTESPVTAVQSIFNLIGSVVGIASKT